MLNIPQKTLFNIKRLLLRQKREVEQNLKKIEKDDPVKDGILAESSEPGTESWIAEGHAKAATLGNNLKDIAYSAKKALSKIRHGTYGQCEKCGKAIEIKRLLVIPTTKYCMVCSAKKK